MRRLVSMSPAELAALTPRQLAGFSVQEVVGLNAAQRAAVTPNLPANMYAAGGPTADVTLPGGATLPLPGPDINVSDPIGAAAGAVTGAVGDIGQAILGPLAEVLFGLVLAGAGAALVVWALIGMSRRQMSATLAAPEVQTLVSGATTAAKSA